jgi:hypothetical protein
VRPVSAAFNRTVVSSHKAIFRATLCTTFQTGTNPAGEDLAVLGGAVTLDATAETRGRLELTTDGNRRWPRSSDDPLAPYGNEVYVKRGVQYHDGPGGVELVGLGYFRLNVDAQDAAPDGPITIHARDRMGQIKRARLLSPRQYLAGTTVGAVIDDLVLEVYPDAVIEWDAGSTKTLPRSVIVQRDRWEFLDELVKARGKIWYWDHRGVLVIKTAPDPTVPVWDIVCGQNGLTPGTLVDEGRELTDEGIFNAVVAEGEGADDAPPVRGVAIDDNPLSPTYYFGRFGPVPRFFASQFLETDGQAFTAAAELLRQSTGLTYSVDLQLSPHPGLEPDDPVTVRAAPHEPSEVHILDTLTIPLTNDAPMSAQTRQQSVVLIGRS